MLGDSAATELLINQTVDILQERVRSNPIPVVKCLNVEEENIICNQIKTQVFHVI